MHTYVYGQKLPRLKSLASLHKIFDPCFQVLARLLPTGELNTRDCATQEALKGIICLGCWVSHVAGPFYRKKAHLLLSFTDGKGGRGAIEVVTLL